MMRRAGIGIPVFQRLNDVCGFSPSVPNENRTDHVLQDRTVYVLLTDVAIEVFMSANSQ